MEVRESSRDGKRPDVDQCFDSVGLQDCDQFFQCARGMSDGVERCQQEFTWETDGVRKVFGWLRSAVTSRHLANRGDDRSVLLGEDGSQIEHGSFV